jgi:hypothetical protein
MSLLVDMDSLSRMPANEQSDWGARANDGATEILCVLNLSAHRVFIKAAARSCILAPYGIIAIAATYQNTMS